jgi:hypothetical protein
MATLRVWDRGTARRLAAVDALQFPSGARQRFGFEHETMTSADLQLVEAATRQWFRLIARQPKAKLSMPSVAADAMWHEVSLHTREYDDFCAGAFGRALHHVPASSVNPESAGPGLHAAYRLACVDEPAAGNRLPLLFRLDRELGLTDGHHYLADCGGRGQCFGVPGARCLQHIAGLEKSKRKGWRIKDGAGGAYGGTSSCGGGGCGGGGCGGGN